MSMITTHVLDIAAGEPAAGVAVVLEYCEEPMRSWTVLNQGITDGNGRLQNLLASDHAPQAGSYRLRFDTSTRSSFFPEVVVQFVISDLQQHYHVPLLLTHFGYTVYRGSKL
jgi:5-hydroxyisourate hydrolase